MSMLCADPDNVHPIAYILYANKIQLFLPKMSLSFPYKGLNSLSGWVERKVKGELKASNCKKVSSGDPTGLLQFIKISPDFSES
jgi:hypothetical protein